MYPEESIRQMQKDVYKVVYCSIVPKSEKQKWWKMESHLNVHLKVTDDMDHMFHEKLLWKDILLNGKCFGCIIK